jgi:hypothetical protein
MVSAKRTTGIAIVALVLATLAATGLVAHANAPPGRYVDAGVGAVTDTKTGLTWQVATTKSDGGGIHDLSSAQSACSLLGAGWILPDIKQLETLVDESGQSLPLIDQTAFPGTPNAPFWSKTVSIDDPNKVFVLMPDGQTHAMWTNGQPIDGISNPYVRCVLPP